MGTGNHSAFRRPASYRAGASRTNWRTTTGSVNRGPFGGTAGTGSDLSTVVLTDVTASARRDAQSQRRMRQDLYAIVRDVVRYVGLDLDTLATTDTGDGLRLLFPFSLLEPVRVVDMFILGLAAGLREHRQYVSELARIRMRVAFDFGHIERDPHGWTGDPLVRVARLIDAEPLRAALLADRGLDLAVVVSDGFFETVLRHGHGYVRPSCFREIQVSVKEFDARAWQLGSRVLGMCERCQGMAA